MKKIAFVIPWYAENISGGAESALREITQHLKDKNIELEIITTCVQQFSSDWSLNYYKEGLEQIQGIMVRRFKVKKRKSEEFDKINFKFMNNITVDIDGEDIFLKEMVNSNDMYQYIANHKEEYSLFVFIPYMFGITYFGLEACLDKAVLIPCLHDENYAYMQRFKDLFCKVKGMVFLSYPECQLANNIYDLNNVQTEVIGTGIATDIKFDAERFREKYGIWNNFILYAGRKDSGKNLDTLIKYFGQYKQQLQTDLKLVLIGGGKIEIPTQVSKDIIDLGYVSVQDKYDAYASAVFLCQPSKYESFSIVIMESWLCKRPVVVYERCEVTTNFVKEAKGGLYFKSYEEFCGVVSYLLNHEDKCKEMGECGHEFVINHYSWDIITQKYISYFKQIIDNSFVKEKSDLSNGINILEQLKLEPYIVYDFDKYNGSEIDKAVQIFDAYKKNYGGNLKLVFLDIPTLLCKEMKDIISIGYVSLEDKEEIISNAKGVWISYSTQYSYLSILKILKLQVILIVNGNDFELMSLCSHSNSGLYYLGFSEFVGILNYIEEPSHIEEMQQLKKNSYYYVNKIEDEIFKEPIENVSAYTNNPHIKIDRYKIEDKIKQRERKISNELINGDDVSISEIVHAQYRNEPVQIICYGEIGKKNHQDDIMLIYHYYHSFINNNSELMFIGSYDERSDFFQLIIQQIKELCVENIFFISKPNDYNKKSKKIIISLSDNTDWYYTIPIEDRENTLSVVKNMKEWMQFKKKIILFQEDIEFVAELLGELTLEQEEI